MTRYATTVIMNERCSFDRVQSVAVDDGMIISIGRDKLGYYENKKNSLSSYVTASHKIFKRTITENTTEAELNRQNQALCFSLNVVGDDDPVILGETYTFQERRRLHVLNCYPSIHEVNPEIFKRNKLKISEAKNRKQVDNVYKISYAAIKKSPSFLFTISRFNNCLVRQNNIDQHIDLAIALESIISSSQEVGFKFALLNASINSSDFEKKKEIFNRLKKLYDIRSKIVHGSHNGEFLTDVDFQNLTSVCKISILYKAQFLQSGLSEASWKKHQNDLMLGKEKREI